MIKSLYPTLNLERLKEKPFLKGVKISGFEFLNLGAKNSTVKMNLSNGKNYVVKFYGRKPLLKESLAINLLDKKIQCPVVIYEEKDLIVTTFIDGEHFNPKKHSFDLISNALFKISQIKFNNPGKLIDNNVIEPWPFDGHHGFFKLMLENEQVKEWITPVMTAELITFINKNSDLLNVIKNDSTLVHGDFNFKNLLVNKKNELVIIDWEFSHSGSFYMDLGNFIRELPDENISDFEKSLIKSGFNLHPDWIKLAKLIDLSASLEFLSSDHNDTVKKHHLGKIKDLVKRY